MITEEEVIPGIVSKPIPGWPDYRAADDGTIWSRRRWGFWKPLKPCTKNRHGRPMVSLWTRDSERKMTTVHRLVLMAFVGPPPDGMEVCHNDGNCLNNRPENLRWDTRKGNMADTLKHGTHVRGERNGSSKLSLSDVDAVKKSISEGLSQKSIAKKFGVSQTTVSYINTGKAWCHPE